MRLTPHIYLLCGQMYGSHQNVYAIETDNSIILVDSGLGRNDFIKIQKQLTYWKLDKKPISTLLLTHEHFEHISNASKFQDAGAKIYAHPKVAEAINAGNDAIMRYAYVDAEPLQTFTIDKVINHNERFKIDNVEIQVLACPGHSHGCIMYEIVIDDEIIVFSGDAILVTTLCHKAAFGSTLGIDYNEEVYITSLKTYASHYATILLPGHGELCMRKAHQIFIGAFLLARQTFLRNHYKDYLMLEEGMYADQ